MICKENSIDVISIGGNTTSSLSANTQLSNGGSGIIINGHATLQHRRKSQLITFSASTCDIKNSLSHEIITPNNCNTSHLKNNPRNSLVGSIGSGNVMGMPNPRLSFAEEDIMVTNCHNGQPNGSYTGSGSGSGSGCGSGGPDQELEDEVFRRRSLEVDEEAQEALYEEEYGTHIEMKSNNANDDSGGGSYEDSHAMHSSLGGSNRNSLEKDDDDDMEVDVISTDVSCYDQLLGSSCNTRNDDDDIATIVADGETYTKFTKNTFKKGLNGVGAYSVNGVTIGGNNGGGDCSSGGIGENGGVIYANPFMDDEGIAESGM